jgi:hypothetical protein
MAKFVNRTGIRYGRLVALAASDKRTLSGAVMWDCLCDCGSKVTCSGSSLHAGDSASCGCLFLEVAAAKGRAKKTHGMTKTKAYKSWAGMRDRCNNENNKKYKNYGGRGIKVCDRWNEFVLFLDDMGEPKANQSLDRIDVNGNYEPSNCRWANQSIQQNNRRNNVIIEFNGIKMTMAEYCRSFGLNSDKVQQRLARGWSVDRALKP